MKFWEIVYKNEFEIHSLKNKTSKDTAFQWPNIQLLLHKKGLFFFFLKW